MAITVKNFIIRIRKNLEVKNEDKKTDLTAVILKIRALNIPLPPWADLLKQAYQG
jgi:hypothetical protein